MRGLLISAAVGAVLAGLAAWTVQGWRHEAAISALVAVHAQAMQEYADAAYAASEAARSEEQRRIAAQQESEHETQRQVAAATARERIAADDRVRSVADEYAARYRGVAERASAAAGRDAAGAAIGMFAELLGRTDSLAEVYAAAHDRARVAGLACERAYESLR